MLTANPSLAPTQPFNAPLRRGLSIGLRIEDRASILIDESLSAHPVISFLSGATGTSGTELLPCANQPPHCRPSPQNSGTTPWGTHGPGGGVLLRSVADDGAHTSARKKGKYMGQDTISIGWLRWMYNLSTESAKGIVQKCPAKLNSGIQYVDEYGLYTKDIVNKIFQRIIDLSKGTLNGMKEVVKESEGREEIQRVSYEDENLFISWLSSSDATKLYGTAYYCSKDKRYIEMSRTPTVNSTWFGINLVEFLRIPILDTCNVNIAPVVIHLHRGDYELPRRQHLESRPDCPLTFLRIKNILENNDLPPKDGWEKLLAKLQKVNEIRACKFALAKFDKKTHLQAYRDVVGETDDHEKAKRLVSRDKKYALRLAYDNALIMPDWDAS